MKKLIFGCSVLLSAALMFTACNKGMNKEPEVDSEHPDFQSSKDVAFASNTVADIDFLISYMADNNYQAPIYVGVNTGTTNISVTPDTNGVNKKVTVSFTNSVLCKDGHKRNGQIIVTFNPNLGYNKFYRRPNYTATVTLSNYSVDGWQVDDNTPILIKNTTSYPVGSQQLKWSITADVTLKNADSSNIITWKGTMLKTLENTNDVTVYNPSDNAPITWHILYNNQGAPISNGARITYAPNGKELITGVTGKTKAYKMVIDPLDEKKLLTRSFACSPDAVVGYSTVTTPSVSIIPIRSEWHPFIAGVVSFTTDLPEPRKIDFSNEDAETCDNSGTIIVKGIQYPITFPK